MEVEGKVSLTIKELDGLRETIKELQAANNELASHEKEVKIELTLEDRSYAIAQYQDNIDRYGKIVSREAIGSKYPTVKRVDYRNLDDVKSILANEARELVRDEMSTLNEYISKRDLEIIRLKKAAEEAKVDFKVKKDEIKAQFLAEEKVLLDRIAELNGKAAERTKDKQLAQATEDLARVTRNLELTQLGLEVAQSQLDAEKAKPWHKKLFN